MRVQKLLFHTAGSTAVGKILKQAITDKLLKRIKI